MSIETLQQAKEKVQSLTESVWVFAALNVLIEADVFAVLNEKTTISSVLKTAKLPSDVLMQTIHVLAEAGFLTIEKETVSFAPGIAAWVQQMGLEKITAQLRATFGLSSEFITASRANSFKAGWHHTDEYLLQAQGTHSEYIVTDCIPQDAYITDLLNQPNACFLDVGAGVGKISLRLCQAYDNVNVVALEPADVPFSLAKKNIAASDFHHRIELRKAYLESIQDKDKYDVVWFPHVFFTEASLKACLLKIWDSLKPGGKIVTTAICPATPSTHILRLINALYGGLRSTDDVTKALLEVGFNDISVFTEIARYRTITAVKT